MLRKLFRRRREPTPQRPKPSATELEHALRGFLAPKTATVDMHAIDADQELFTSGILDSLTFADLVAFIEDELYVRLSGVVDVTMESLGTVNRMVAQVQTI